VVPGLEDYDVIAVDQVHEAVLLVDPPRPTALQNMFQLLGLADPRQRITQCGIEQTIDPLARGPIRRLPVEVVLPAVWREDETH
jgi:hypothetical protein